MVQNTAVTILTRMEQLLAMEVSQKKIQLDKSVIDHILEPNHWCGRPKQLERVAKSVLQRDRCTFDLSPSENRFMQFSDFLFPSFQSVIRKLGQGIQPLADRTMTIILSLIQRASKASTVLEDTFLVVGSLASGMLHVIAALHKR